MEVLHVEISIGSYEIKSNIMSTNDAFFKENKLRLLESVYSFQNVIYNILNTLKNEIQTMHIKDIEHVINNINNGVKIFIHGFNTGERHQIYKSIPRHDIRIMSSSIRDGDIKSMFFILNNEYVKFLNTKFQGTSVITNKEKVKQIMKKSFDVLISLSVDNMSEIEIVNFIEHHKHMF